MWNFESEIPILIIAKITFQKFKFFLWKKNYVFLRTLPLYLIENNQLATVKTRWLPLKLSHKELELNLSEGIY